MELSTTDASRQEADSATRLPYIPAIDGLRALAVAAVLFYHAGLKPRGGFLGVESFFVLSGFLITGLLLAEWHDHDRVDLINFWQRRARRLLPALFLLFLGTLGIAFLLAPRELPDLREDTLMALAYVMNWHLTFSGTPYFDPAARPPLLQHLWSLAVEEQFYLLWPVVFRVGMRYLRAPGLLFVILAGAVASTALMMWLYQPGADPSRVYYGTDTRATALLVGAALAFLWMRPPSALWSSRATGLVLDSVGLVALAMLIGCYYWLYASHPLLYRGGFAAVSLITGLIILAVAHPRSAFLSRLLGLAPLRWIGLRSYSIYLWHWPIFLVTRPRIDVPLSGWPLLLLRVALVIVLADLSYRLVERPLRAPGAVGRLLRAPHVGYVARAPALLLVAFVLVQSSPAMVRERILTTDHSPIPTHEQTDENVCRTSDAVAAANGGPCDSAGLAPSRTEGSNNGTQELPEEDLGAFDPELAATLREIVEQAVADGHIPGAVLAVHVPEQGTYVTASGLADVEQGRPMERNSLVRIGSVSKLFTAAVVLQLAEEGKLKLNAPVATWLPNVPTDGEDITVRQLLQHTTGLYDYLEDRSFIEEAYSDPDRVWAPEELVEYAARFPPIFAPGTEGGWDYSSTNYVILGMLVEEVTGNSLAQEMRRRIFEPLALQHTFFLPDEEGAFHETLVQGYTDASPQPNVSATFVFGTASIVSTAADLERFARGLFGGEIISAESLDTMLTFVDGYGAYDMPRLAYGLGVMRNELPVGPDAQGEQRSIDIRRVFGHIGGVAGFRSAVWYAAETGVTIAICLNQGAIDPNAPLTDAFDAVLTHEGH